MQPVYGWSNPEVLDQILPNVFLGSESQAYKDDLLKKYGITHILPVGASLSRKFPEQFSYIWKFIDVLDFEHEDLLSHFEDCFDFVDEVVEQGGKVLIHCAAGVSRSPTVMVGYVMYKKKMSAEEAMAFVKEKRAWINPNPGFLRQLSLFQDLGYKIDEEDEKYIQYKQEVEQHRAALVTFRSAFNFSTFRM
jgi:hypothetical protein